WMPRALPPSTAKKTTSPPRNWHECRSEPPPGRCAPMKAFAELYACLDATTSSNAKLAAMRDYFALADPADAAWVVYFLAGGRPRQLVSSKLLRQLAVQVSGLPQWLFEESYQAVGDLAETISLLL